MPPWVNESKTIHALKGRQNSASCLQSVTPAQSRHEHLTNDAAADVLDHATSEIAMGTKLGIDATRKLAGEGFKRPWSPLIRMSEDVKAKVEKLFGRNS